MSMEAHGIVFVFSCVVGTLLGVLYDVFRIIRIAFNSKWISVFIQDFLFCIFSALSIILLVYYTNSGIVRWFSLFGCFLCFVLYHMTVGRFIIFVSKKIIDFIRKVLDFLIKITIIPLKTAALFIVKQLRRLNKFIFRLCMRTQRSLYYKIEKRKISHSASYGFGLYTFSVNPGLKKNKKMTKYVSGILKSADKEIETKIETKQKKAAGKSNKHNKSDKYNKLKKRI